jgi:hypothetical protein
MSLGKTPSVSKSISFTAIGGDWGVPGGFGKRTSLTVPKSPFPSTLEQKLMNIILKRGSHA